jgi:hypothetical protein
MAICQNSNKSSSKDINSNYLDGNNIPEVDTLLSDSYFWKYFIVSEDQVFFLKEYNDLYEFNKGIQILKGRIPCYYGPENFVVTKDYIALNVEQEPGRVVLMYNRNNHLLNDSLFDYDINDLLYNENCLILFKSNLMNDSIFFYDLKLMRTIQKLGNLNYTFVDNESVFLYNMLTDLKQTKSKLEIIKLDRKKLTSTYLTLTCNKNYEILHIYKDKYLAKEDNKLMMFSLDGKLLNEWEVNASGSYTVLCAPDKIMVYNWLNTDVETLDKYYFVRQTIDLKK